ncbi:MAG: oligosaccharide flippase family protein, partial [Ignavibacteriae bacterium]|nr:oligosaccharide flippase family protein [Ignavibacteriota bacterium]
MINDEGYGSNLLNRLFKNSFFLVTSRISDIGVAIITTPFIARYLGLKAFGDYALVTAISIFVKPLVEFGSEAIICRDVA